MRVVSGPANEARCRRAAHACARRIPASGIGALPRRTTADVLGAGLDLSPSRAARTCAGARSSCRISDAGSTQHDAVAAFDHPQAPPARDPAMNCSWPARRVAGVSWLMSKLSCPCRKVRASAPPTSTAIRCRSACTAAELGSMDHSFAKSETSHRHEIPPEVPRLRPSGRLPRHVAQPVRNHLTGASADRRRFRRPGRGARSRRLQPRSVADHGSRSSHAAARRPREIGGREGPSRRVSAIGKRRGRCIDF